MRRETTILSALLLQAPCAFSKQAVQDPHALKSFKNALMQDGFEVRTGAVVVWNPAAEWCAGTIDNAMYFSNEPYLQVQVPTLAQQPELRRDLQLEPDEAIVLIGLTPPPVRYFSYTPYIDRRVYPDGRKQILASIGDAVNNATIKTTGRTPFNRPVALVFTPDQTTDARIRGALHRAGYPSAIINTVVLPASVLKLGRDEAADQIFIGVRMAIWQKETDRSSYMAHPPLSVFRVTPHTSATANPFSTPELRVRGTGQTEMKLMNKLGELRQGILDANPGLHATDIVLSPMCNEGYDLIQRGIEMCGDSRESFYVGAGLPEWDSTNHITLADDEFLMIYVSNHVATGKATYTNTNVYVVTWENDPDNIAKLSLGAIDDRDFQDTASPYLPDGDPAADLMYTYKISRNCGGEPNCLQLSLPQDCTRLKLDSSTVLAIFTRIYLEPATRVGPAMPEILYDRVIKFSLPSPYP